MAAKKILLDIPYDESIPNSVSDLLSHRDSLWSEIHAINRTIDRVNKMIRDTEKRCKHVYHVRLKRDYGHFYTCIHCGKQYRNNNFVNP